MSGIAEHGAKHLYVFQSDDGLIKIGRSDNPMRRRASLQSSGGRKIHILLVLKNRGNDEMIIHQKVAEYRLYGEWFKNTPQSQHAICEAIGVDFQFRKSSEDRRAEIIQKREEADARESVRAYVEKMEANPPRRKRQTTNPTEPWPGRPSSIF